MQIISCSHLMKVILHVLIAVPYSMCQQLGMYYMDMTCTDSVGVNSAHSLFIQIPVRVTKCKVRRSCVHRTKHVQCRAVL